MSNNEQKNPAIDFFNSLKLDENAKNDSQRHDYESSINRIKNMTLDEIIEESNHAYMMAYKSGQLDILNFINKNIEITINELTKKH